MNYSHCGAYCPIKRMLETTMLTRANDQLRIITDGAAKPPGIATTLYVTASWVFSAKLRDREVTWLRCEIEALSIAAATKHFSPYIVQSKTPSCILRDSMCPGISETPSWRVLLKPSRHYFPFHLYWYQASVRHVDGAAFLPSDFGSRNTPDCDSPTCQVCTFAQRTKDSVVLRPSV